jgi:hypothetical protein
VLRRSTPARLPVPRWSLQQSLDLGGGFALGGQFRGELFVNRPDLRVFDPSVASCSSVS